jgi:hypothetical protein
MPKLPIRHPQLQKSSKTLAAVDVASLRVLPKLARIHVFDHALAQRGVRIPPSPPYHIGSNNIFLVLRPGLALNVCAISFASLSSRHEIRRADQLAQVDPMRVVKLDIRASKTDSRRGSGVNLELKSFVRRGASA